MIRVILIGPNSRLIASIINTVTSTYIVDTTYNGLLCVDSSSIPTSVSDTDLYALWHYTTSNVWATHSASPGTYYKWISEEGASQYTWVYTEPNPVVSIISTISDFQSVTLYWNVTDSNWTDVTFSVELSKISDFSTTIDIGKKYIFGGGK